MVDDKWLNDSNPVFVLRWIAHPQIRGHRVAQLDPLELTVSQQESSRALLSTYKYHVLYSDKYSVGKEEGCADCCRNYVIYLGEMICFTVSQVIKSRLGQCKSISTY